MLNKIKNIIDYIFVKILVILGNKFCLALFARLINGIQNYTNTFITYHQRPQRASSILTTSQSGQCLPKLAIIIQGPLITKDEFTLETIKLYIKLFPNAIIILSTWIDEKQNLISRFDSLGICILLNKKPDYAGFSNINLQIISTLSGINKAKELDVEYVIKTRTDQRIYSPNVLSFLFNIINVFPLNSSVNKQRKRIVGLSLNTFKYRMYGLSDMFTFGHLSDMLLYWDIPLDNRSFSPIEIKKYNLTLRSYANWKICEVYLMTEFLKKTNRSLLWTLKDSWDVFANHFCIIDTKSIDLYWGKYNFAEDRWVNYYEQLNKYEEMTFKSWLDLYSNFSNLEIPEYLLDEPL